MLEGFYKRSTITILLLLVLLVSFFFYATTPQPAFEPRGEGVALWNGTEEWAATKVNDLSRDQLISQLIAVQRTDEGGGDDRSTAESYGALISPRQTRLSNKALSGGTPNGPLRIDATPWYASFTAASGGIDFAGSEVLTISTASEPGLAYGVTRHSAKRLRDVNRHTIQVLDVGRGDVTLQHGSRILEETLTASARSRILSLVNVSIDSFTEADFSFRHYIPFVGSPRYIGFPEGLHASIAGGARSVYLYGVTQQVQKDQIIATLRQDEAFDGLIIAETCESISPEELANLLTSGLSLFATSRPDHVRSALESAVERELLSVDDLQEAVQRSYQARAWMYPEVMDQEPPPSTVENGSAASRLSTIIYQNSITLVQDSAEFLPLSPGDNLLHLELSASEAGSENMVLSSELSRIHPDTLLTIHGLQGDLSPAEMDAILENAGTSSAAVATLYPDVDEPYRIPATHQEILSTLASRGHPLVIIAMGSPEILAQVPRNATSIIWHPSRSNDLQQHAAHSLYGSVGFRGSLPRNATPDLQEGHGIIRPPTSPVNAPPEAAGMRPASLNHIGLLLNSAIEREAFPGAAVAVGRAGQFVFARGAGTYTYEKVEPVTTTSLFDLASLTKPIATTTAIMQLYERELLDLDDPVSSHLPSFQGGLREDVTILHLLAHTSGLPSHRAFHQEDIVGADQIIRQIMNEPLRSDPGSRTVYSDLGFITLALIIEEVTGQSFAEYVRLQIFRPLRMYSTSFRPAGIGPDPSVVPTEQDRTFRNTLLQGEVHDETAYLLGGTAGHSGLFSTAEDLALFAHMLVNDGAIHGQQFLQPETIELFTTRLDPNGSTRALGWDTRTAAGYSSAGQLFGPNSYGHTGFTGTSFWIDPDEQLYVILLTNRVHPSRENRLILEIRPQVADLGFEAIDGPPEILLPGIVE